MVGIRPTSTVYPNLRTCYWKYGSSGSVADDLSRLASIVDNDDSSTLASYRYNGVGRMVIEDFEEPAVRLDANSDYSAPDPAGTYEGLDRFGRAK